MPHFLSTCISAELSEAPYQLTFPKRNDFLVKCLYMMEALGRVIRFL